MIVRGELEDLRRRPPRRADLAGHARRVRDVLLEEAGEAEVGDLGQAMVREQHVLALEVPVDDHRLLLVQVVAAHGHVGRDVDRLRQRELDA